MSTFKKTQVVMLPTNEASYLCKVTEESFNFHKDSLVLTYDGHMALCGKAINQQLYFLSDEEIKKGDWMLNLAMIQRDEIEIPSISDGRDVFNSKNGWFKIIASTDENLIIGTISQMQKERKRVETKIYLPQPSSSFIKKFYEKYNLKNQIKEVMVEYVKMYRDMTGEHEAMMLTGREYDKLKINPKDNTITIKSVVNSYSEKELFENMQYYMEYCQANGYVTPMKWLSDYKNF